MAGMSNRLVDELISILRAPWMDKTENLLLKINRVLDMLHGLFDWRNPSKCCTVAAGIALTALFQCWCGPP